MWDEIKKFGLQHCDLPSLLWNVAFMLRATTLNIDSRNKTPIPLFVYLLCLLIALAYFYVYGVSMVWFVFVKCFETGDVLNALIIFSLGISSHIGTVKLVYMLLHMNKVKKIVSEMLECDATVVPISRFSNNLLFTLREVKKRAMVFWLVIICNGVAYMMKPVLIPGRHLMDDNFILFGLEPMYETPNYHIAFVLTAAGITFTCYISANVTAFLIVVIGYIEAQMLALSEELVYLWEDAEKHYESMKPSTSVSDEQNSHQVNKGQIVNRYIEEHLIKIIESHSRNINIMHEVENVFSGAIALEFFLLVIALIAELLGGLENTYLQVPFAMMQVGMDCFTGQRLMDASIKFENAVYDCKWENYDKTNMKTVQIMLTSAQKTMMLSAGGIITLSFSCLMQVNKSIYSAYTTLRTTMK